MKKKLMLSRGFTLVEIMIVVVIMAITGSMVMSNYSSVNATKLTSAAKVLVADIEYTQIQSMAHGEDLRVIVFDTVNHKYRIATTSDNNVAVTNPIGKTPYELTFGLGQLAHLGQVEIASIDLNGDNVLGFNVLGNIDQMTEAKITLTIAGHQIDITINPTTGEPSISNIY